MCDCTCAAEPPKTVIRITGLVGSAEELKAAIRDALRNSRGRR